jgi:hypothetical protein
MFRAYYVLFSGNIVFDSIVPATDDNFNPFLSVVSGAQYRMETAGFRRLF